MIILQTESSPTHAIYPSLSCFFTYVLWSSDFITGSSHAMKPRENVMKVKMGLPAPPWKRTMAPFKNQSAVANPGDTRDKRSFWIKISSFSCSFWKNRSNRRLVSPIGVEVSLWEILDPPLICLFAMLKDVYPFVPCLPQASSPYSTD